MKPLLAILAALMVTGCTNTITDSTPTTEPLKLDCDRIFPGVSPNT
ncbi:MAG: lipoprotein [Planctomycetota bacterium]